ncbi:ATP-dependent DNA ligase [Branchiibius cervicis]|uniref:DNA ligase (ATP) n=1 Tax=Branchiibius cervicis TaxID=908252 RepID=A0ABW2AT24_9MICO
MGLFTGELRHGAQDGVMQSAIAEAFDVPPAAVRRAAMLAGDLTDVAATAQSSGAEGLQRVDLQVGRPLRPMLAGSAPSVEAAYGDGADQQFDVECKLDGIRLQAHKDGERVWLFTRSLDDITDRLPEVVEVVRALPAHTAVLDGEAIALRADGRPEPFQVTGSRTASADGVPVSTFFFDVLHADGRTLLDEPLGERIAVLEQLVGPENRIPRRAGADLAQARAAFDEWVGAGHEGVVLKDPGVAYAAGRRGAGWIKVKPRHTLDLVVLAVERGSGRRSEWLSNIHLGARDPQTGELVMVGKTFKGMTDEMLRWQTRRFTELADGPSDGWTVRVRPEQVVEIAFDGVQRSSRYPGGVALRFARVLRYRDDKTAEAADSIEELRRLGWGND